MLSSCGRSLISSLLRNRIFRQIRLYSEENENKKDDEQIRKEQEENFQKTLIVRGQFEHVSKKDKQTYLDMVKVFENRDSFRRNHVEFIYAALKNMELYGVNKDIEIYKALINVMPKGKFIPTNIFQVEFMHYPKQQQCIIDLLEQMEDNGVIPDYEMESMLVNVFGRKGFPVRKYWRMMYWMPKFNNLSPWLLPNPVPDDTLELARMAVERMCSVDLQSKIDVFNTKDVESALDDTWIVSGQSPEQSELLARHKKNEAIHIEGPYLIWLRNRSVNYFTLRGDPPPKVHITGDQFETDDVSSLKVPFLGIGINHQRPINNKITLKKSIHEQEDGTIFAICCTGTSTKDSLLSWIRLLGKNGNPDLETIPVVFKFRSPIPNPQLMAVQEDEKT